MFLRQTRPAWLCCKNSLCCQLHKRSTAGKSGFVFQNRGKLFEGQYLAWEVRLLVNIDRTVFCENLKVYWPLHVLGYPVHIADELLSEAAISIRQSEG